MDYEKAYKEARERAKAFLGKGFRGEDLLVECVFPELKESEDEKIRKMLIEQMERWKKAAEENGVEQDVNDATSAIAYLERQKERELVGIEKMTHPLYVEGFEAGKEVGAQAEALKHIHTEWSEEDENFIKELCNLLASIAKNNYVGGYYAPDLVSKLQSLRPHPHWKPSEEQMAVLKNAIHFYGKTVGKEVLESLYNELKKL